MSIMANIKANKAYSLQAKGEIDKAETLYKEALGMGLNHPRYLLGYSVLLLRAGRYQEAREILVKTQKAPGLNEDQRSQMIMNYAAAMYRLGDIDKGIGLMERQHLHSPSGRMYQTLGYLYVVKYSAENRPDFDVEEAARAVAEENALEAAEEAAEAALDMDGVNTGDGAAEAEDSVLEPQLSAREAWEQGIARAKAFIEESIDYDDEDSICLDNMGQFYYRVLEDKVTAKEWFDKAIAQKDDQMDTLWFLSRYDLEKGDRQAALQKLETIRRSKFSPLNYVEPAMVDAEIARLKAEG